MGVKLNGNYTDDCLLYRNSHIQFVNDDATAKSSAFSPKAGMSTDWDKLTTPENSLIRVGLSRRHNSTQYKDANMFKLFSLKIEDIKLIEGVSSVDFTPIYNFPEILGSPNNPSHTDVWFTDVELRVKFADIAKSVQVDMDHVNLAVNYAVK